MTSRGARSPNGPRITSVDLVVPRRRGRIIWLSIVFLAALTGTAASGETMTGKIILAGLQRFMLFYAGVFALVALTAAVGVGLAATDRIFMVPSTRVVAQAVHRAVSLAALGFLAIHIVTEILAHRSRATDAFIPFLAQRRTLYLGLGTIASDLMLILIVTGLARSRFVGKWPWTWRAIHATAYLCWAMSIVHGLLAGRTAKPYVDWSYGACVAAVLLALIIRLVATMRDRRETAAQAVRPSTPSSVPAAMSAMAPLGFQPGRAAADTLPGTPPRALPRALPAADADPAAAHVPAAYPGQPRGSHRYQERAHPGAPSYPRPGHRGSSAYAPGYAAGPAAAAAYQWPGAGAQPPKPRLALPAGESGAQRPAARLPYQQPAEPAPAPQPPYPQGPYAQPSNPQPPYAQQSYPQPPYAQPSHGQRPYPQQPHEPLPYPQPPPAQQPSPRAPSAGQPGQPYLKHYMVVPLADYDYDDAYENDDYPGDRYPPDFSGPPPDLGPEHPSGPFQVYDLVSDPPDYLPPARRERP